MMAASSILQSRVDRLARFKGMAAGDGRGVSGEAHLRASIHDILTTPVGSRVMRRDYGSRLFQLLDLPAGPGLLADVVAATAEALELWEPRVDVVRVEVFSTGPAASAGRWRVDVSVRLAASMGGGVMVLEDVA
jgi:uncharacterized protein